MANQNINQLTEETTPVDGDYTIIWDTSGADDNKVAIGTIRRNTVTEVTSSGAQSGAGSSKLHIVLNHASAINYTITGAPTAGDELTVYIETTAAHTLLLSGSVTYDGTNQTCTFSTAGQSIHMIARSATRWDIIKNDGTLSA